VVPPDTWSPADPNNYVACVGYGGYTGPTKTSTHDDAFPSGTPTDLPPGDGTKSLSRVAFTGNNVDDFDLMCPTATNNAGAIGSFGPCGPGTTTTTTVSTTSTLPTSTTTTTLPPLPMSKCTSKKFALAGKKALATAKCHGTAVKKGILVDGECITKAETKFGEGWAKEETKDDGCLTTMDVTTIEDAVDSFIANLVSALVNDPTSVSTCTSKKLTASGKNAQSLTKCYSKALGKGASPENACILKAEDKLPADFLKAEKAPDCQGGTDDASIIAIQVHGLADTLVALLVP